MPAVTHMTQHIFKSAAVLAVAALLGGCTIKDQEPPPFAGPSEFGQSVVVSVNPDSLPQDGASQSLVTVLVRDPDSSPMRNVTLRVETRVGGTPVDFGTLSARSIVTGPDGRATFVYTAPAAPSVTVDSFTIVDIGATPIGTDFNNAVLRTAAIRLTPPGVIVPPGDLNPRFTMTPGSPVDNQTVLFDASTSTGSIAEYQWNFGDGRGGSGRTTQHAYATPGTYVVTLTLVDGFGRAQSSSQSITVLPASQPSAAFVFSPTNPRVGTQVNFNASASRAPAGSSIVSYRWDFGDGMPLVTTGNPVVSKTYTLPATYNVTLVVTDNAGRTATITLSIQIQP
jgi:PKD repeat protein